MAVLFETGGNEADGAGIVVAFEAILAERPSETFAGEEFWSLSVPLGRAGGVCCCVGGLMSLCEGSASASMDDGEDSGCDIELYVLGLECRDMWCGIWFKSAVLPEKLRLFAETELSCEPSSSLHSTRVSNYKRQYKRRLSKLIWIDSSISSSENVKIHLQYYYELNTRADLSAKKRLPPND